MKNRKKIVACFSFLLATILIFSFVFLFPNNAGANCRDYQMDKNSEFFKFLAPFSEKTRIEGARNRGMAVDNVYGTWRGRENRYDIFYEEDARKIADNPSLYLCEATEVIQSTDYDQSQKMYTAIVMQKLPINEYIYFMKIANEAFEKGIISDKMVMINIISPALDMKGTSASYWWLPAWREQYNKHADELFSSEEIKSTLDGSF